MQFWVFVFIVAAIVIGSKIKKAIEEEAARANRYAEEMKRKHAGQEDGGAQGLTPPPRVGPAEPGGHKGSLQNLLSALVTQASEAQKPRQAPPAPRMPQAVMQEPSKTVAYAGEGQRSIDLARDFREEKADWKLDTAIGDELAERERARASRRKEKKQRQKVREVSPALAMSSPAFEDLAGDLSASPIPVQVPGGSNAFFEQLSQRSPWQAAIVLHEVLGKPRAFKPLGDDFFG